MRLIFKNIYLEYIVDIDSDACHNEFSTLDN